MPASNPPAFPLSITTNDFINYKGVLCAISNVGAGSDNGKGVISYALTLVASGNPVITVSAQDTVLESKETLASGTVVQTFKQSANA